ncbi:MAG TPA: serine/threonine-protein kinase [Steroidobacteraceae bacterium]|nr:serine/threonine-protein kinase [Steroidobacteraceae bacterium]
MSGLDQERWKRVIQHLDQVLELPEPDWAAYLAELSREDPVTATHVGRLLHARTQPEFAEFLAGAIPLGVAGTAAASLVGRPVGPYVIEAEIGHGGMGSVWRARRADGRFEGSVAVKLPYLAWLGKAGAQRFLNEGRLLGRLDHPHIARLIDAGVLEGTQPYLILEYIEGSPIDAYCNEHHLDVRARVRLFLDVLAAVAHAHRQLVVHRDIKPANIFVTRDGTVKLLDFGVAKMLVASADVLDEPRAESRVLTPEFAAPEQLLGEAVTTVTDVYALGMTLYLVLAGQHPFAAATGKSALGLRTALESEPPRASTWNRELRGDLDNILAKALRPQPQDRYASVDGFAEDLRRFLANEAVSAAPDSMAYRVRKFVRRHRTSVAAAALAAVILIAATVVTSFEMIEARVQRDDARFQQRRAESVNEFLNALLLSEGGPGRPALSTKERLDLGVRMLESEYAGEPSFAGRMLIQLADQYGSGDDADGIALDQRAYLIGKRARDPELMALSQCNAARAEARSNITANVPKRLAEAQQLSAHLSQPSVALQVECLRAAAEFSVQRGRLADAEVQLDRARHLLEQSAQTYTASYTSVLNDLGGIYNEAGRLPEALAMAQLIGATHERFGRGGTTARIIALQNEGAVLYSMGEPRRALELYDEAARRDAVHYAPNELPLSLVTNKASTLTRLGRNDEALNLARSAAERAKLVNNMFWLANAERVMFTACLGGGRLNDAQRELDAAAAAIAGFSAPNPRLLTWLDVSRARLELQLGKPADALRNAASAVARTQLPSGRRTLEADTALAVAASAALQAGRPQDAQNYAHAALVIDEAIARGPDTSADVGEVLLLLAKSERAQNPSADVRPLLERAVRSLTNGLGPDQPLTQEAAQLLHAN